MNIFTKFSPKNKQLVFFLQQLKNLLFVLLVCEISTYLAILFSEYISTINTLLIFLVGVLTVTVLTNGFIYGLLASVACILIYNYFFLPPLHAFQIKNLNDLILIFFFMLASLICGTMASKFKHQTKIAKQNEKTAQLVNKISESFLTLTGVHSILKNGIHYLYEYTGYPCRAVLENENYNASIDHYETVDFKHILFNEKTSLILPIKGLSREIGTITLINQGKPLSQTEEIIVHAVLYQMSLILDRELLYQERERIKVTMEAEYLKSTLLRSISHDIRSPLTGIIGASNLILESYDTLDQKSMQKLATDINEEAAWLYHFVQNILDMTRISDGKLILGKEFESVDDLFNQAIIHVAWLKNSERLTVLIPDEILLVECDGKLIVQVLVNLLDNAHKHSGKDAAITLRAFLENDSLVFEVSDNGNGIDEHIKDTLFDSYVTLPRKIADSTRGVGLGLGICKTIVEAHNGTICAFNNHTGGATFQILLPYELS